MDRNFNAVQIEIVKMVALRKESVDRNQSSKPAEQAKAVALRKESVDRNYIIKITGTAPRRRSPQGERG